MNHFFQEFWENKRRQDEEREKLEALKNKDKHEQSAIASSEVKQKLAGFLLNKKQREAAAGFGGGNNACSPGMSIMSPTGSVVKGPPGPLQSHPYRRPMLMGGKYEDDFPLRKTGLRHLHFLYLSDSKSENNPKIKKFFVWV